MILLLKIFFILLALAVIFIMYMLITSKSYPEEWERIYEEELKNKFKEYKKNK